MKKYDYEDVKKLFENKGCKLLSTEYVNSRQLLQFKCKCNNIAQIRYNDFKTKNKNRDIHVCTKCYMRTTINFENVKKYFESKGCKLLTDKDVYVNTNKLLEYECCCGNILKKSFGDFKFKNKNEDIHKCNKCEKRIKFNEVKKYFEDKGCKLLSLESEYLNCYTPLKYQCVCGNISSRDFKSFKKANENRHQHCCKKCFDVKNHKTKTTKEVNDFFQKNNCKLQSAYKNTRTKVSYTCSCGTINEIWYKDFKNKKHKNCCPQCLHAKNKEKISDFFKKYNCELLSYKDCRNKLSFKCSCGRIDEITWEGFKGSKHKLCKQCLKEKTSGKNHCNWNPNREEIKLNKIFRLKCHTVLRHSLEMIGIKKSNRTANLLGYSHIDLKKHIANHWNYKNVCNGKWHLDHIFPIKSFLDHKIYDLKLINCLENLQPLSDAENLKKGDKYDKKEFVNWLKTKNYFTTQNSVI